MTKVVQIHDAAIDEYMATMLLTTVDDIALDGIVIVNADCVYGPAMDTAWKMASHLGFSDIPLSLSRARALNAFPWPYRGDCVLMGEVPALATEAPHPDWPPYPDGDDWLIHYLHAVEEPVTLLVLCPLTPVEMLLRARPDLGGKIERMIWMGGAIDVAGNLDPQTLPAVVANPYAEWNVFWDPPAAQWVLEHAPFPIVLFPLDITDTVPIEPEFMAALVRQGKSFAYSDLAAQSYKLVASESFYDMWDVVTTAYLPRPDLFADLEPIKVRVGVMGDKEGAILFDDDGVEVQVAMKLDDVEGFYSYVLDQFAR